MKGFTIFFIFLSVFFCSYNVYAEETTSEITTQEVTTEQTTSDIVLQSVTEDFTEISTIETDTVQKIVNSSPAVSTTPFKADINTEIINNMGAVIQQLNCKFENGDYFWIRRYGFGSDKAGNFMSSFKIPGNTIEIRYIDPVTKEWKLTTDEKSVSDKITTLYVSTEKYNAILSVAGVYKSDFTANTLTVLKDREKPVIIDKSQGEYIIKIQFPERTDNIGEFWCLQSPNSLVDWNSEKQYNLLKVHDLAFERRWCYDGYYFPTPSNYTPGGNNVLYRHPANYTGASWAKYGGCRAANDLGYIMTKICIENQNEKGFWPTGPQSEWLISDFKIPYYFYDTRFNTDFAVSLVQSYKVYNDRDFLEAAVKYGEFFYGHAVSKHYDKSGGWLVDDYAGNENSLRTHSSLNHQVAEINFLYELYQVTKEQKYYDLAELMLLAIENTKNEWVLPDGNLRYALMYNGTYNTMRDYPYLTYDDLFELKDILYRYFQRTNESVEYLMASKKQWMDNNKVTGYRTT